MYRLLKLSGALLLLFGLILPLSSCTHYEDEKGNHTSELAYQAAPDDIHRVVNYQYALDDFDAAEPLAWLIPLAFSWPLFVVGALMWLRPGPLATALRIAEPFLLAGSTYIVLLLGSMGERLEIGAYVALGALALYTIATLWEDILCLLARSGRHGSNRSTATA